MGYEILWNSFSDVNVIGMIEMEAVAGKACFFLFLKGFWAFKKSQKFNGGNKVFLINS